MKIPIKIEDCFRADEIVRIGRAIRYASLRERYRKAILDEADRELPDYPRPTKAMPRTYKGIGIVTLLKYLLP